MNSIYKFLISALLIFLCIPLISCSTSTEALPADADEITENILTALNNNDYKSFSRDFDATMKGALTEDMFNNELAPMLEEKAGEYIPDSLEVVKTAETGGSIVVIYQTEFTKAANGVAVQISFTETDGKTTVSGLYFNAAELSG